MKSFLVLLIGVCWPVVAMADWTASVDGGIFYDSNLNNAELGQDIHSDSAATAALSAGQFIQLDGDYSLTLTADLKSEAYNRYSGMNNLSLGTTFGLRRKFGLGAAAPWLHLSASAARLEFKDEVRDGWRYRAALGAGKRFAQRWNLEAEYSLEKRTGDHDIPVVPFLSGAVFDLKSRSLTFNVGYTLSENTLLFGGYTWRTGDVVSTSTPNGKIFRASTAITRDRVFGPDSFAYTLDATSHTLQISG